MWPLGDAKDQHTVKYAAFTPLQPSLQLFSSLSIVLDLKRNIFIYFLFYEAVEQFQERNCRCEANKTHIKPWNPVAVSVKKKVCCERQTEPSQNSRTLSAHRNPRCESIFLFVDWVVKLSGFSSWSNWFTFDSWIASRCKILCNTSCCDESRKKNHTDSKQPLVFSGLKTAKPSSDYFVFNTYTREPIETKLIYNQVLNNRAWMGSSSMCMCIYLHIFIYLCTHIFTIYTHTHITL